MASYQEMEQAARDGARGVSSGIRMRAGATPNPEPSGVRMQRVSGEQADGGSAYGIRTQANQRNSRYRNAAMDAAEANRTTAAPQQPVRNRALANAIERLSTRRTHTLEAAQLRESLIDRQMREEEGNRAAEERAAERSRVQSNADRAYGMQEQAFNASEGRAKREEEFRRSIQTWMQDKDQIGEHRDAQARQDRLDATKREEDRRAQDKMDGMDAMQREEHRRATAEAETKDRQSRGDDLAARERYTDESWIKYKASGDVRDLEDRKRPTTQKEISEQASMLGKNAKLLQDQIVAIQSKEDLTPDDEMRIATLQSQLDQTNGDIQRLISPTPQDGGQAGGMDIQDVIAKNPLTAENVSKAREASRVVAAAMDRLTPEARADVEQALQVLNDPKMTEEEFAKAKVLIDMMNARVNGPPPEPRAQDEAKPARWWEALDGGRQAVLGAAAGVSGERSEMRQPQWWDMPGQQEMEGARRRRKGPQSAGDALSRLKPDNMPTPAELEDDIRRTLNRLYK